MESRLAGGWYFEAIVSGSKEAESLERRSFLVLMVVF